MYRTLANVFSYLILICVYINDSNQQLVEGSACRQSNSPGTCQAITNCPAAMEAIRSQKKHNFERCGFKILVEIICCPINSQRNDTPVTGSGNLGIERKSKKICKELYKDFPVRANIHSFYGNDAYKGEFPHMAALGFENRDETLGWYCEATLISSRFLLAAAHCFVCIGCLDPKKARLGTIDLNDSQSVQDIDVKNVVVHPDFNVISKHNDIAIVELTQDVNFTKYIYPACLYDKEDVPEKLLSLGWRNSDIKDQKSKPRILRFDLIDLVPLQQCNLTLTFENPEKALVTSQICGISSNSDFCMEYAGGPLQTEGKEVRYDIVGIVSFGKLCLEKKPVIYTRIYSYLDWIENIVWPDN